MKIDWGFSIYQLPSLYYWRARMYDYNVEISARTVSCQPDASTEKYKHHHKRRKNFFGHRVVNRWNMLTQVTENIVTSPSVNIFKNGLDAFWHVHKFEQSDDFPRTRTNTRQAEPGKSTLNVLNYKYKYFPPQKYLSTSTFLFGEMYLSTFRVLSKCT